VFWSFQTFAFEHFAYSVAVATDSGSNGLVGEVGISQPDYFFSFGASDSVS
jgi:hypothetical protein